MALLPVMGSSVFQKRLVSAEMVLLAGTVLVIPAH
jgi:hypothetical protein